MSKTILVLSVEEDFETAVSESFPLMTDFMLLTSIAVSKKYYDVLNKREQEPEGKKLKKLSSELGLWEGYSNALAHYQNLCLEEATTRGYTNLPEAIEYDEENDSVPEWIGDKNVIDTNLQIASHLNSEIEVDDGGDTPNLFNKSEVLKFFSVKLLREIAEKEGIETKKMLKADLFNALFDDLPLIEAEKCEPKNNEGKKRAGRKSGGGLSRAELLEKCKEAELKGYSRMKVGELRELLEQNGVI